MSLFAQKNLEKLIEVFMVGGIVNTVLGSLGMVMIITLASLAPATKIVLWWFGGIVIAIMLGHTAANKLGKKDVSITILAGGLALGIFVMLVSSSIAPSVFPYLPSSDPALGLQAGIEGVGTTIVEPSFDLMIPAFIGAFVLFAGVIVLMIKKY